jgi:hypothetical protein
MSKTLMQSLILPSCKILALLLVVNAAISLFATLLLSGIYALRVFIDLMMLEGAVMLIVGPTMLFRAQNLLESTGSRILLAGILLFLLSMILALIPTS